MDFNIKNCLRTAAIIYAEGGDHAIKRNTTIRKYIEAVFTLNDNQELSLLDLVNVIENDYKIHFTETEIISVIQEAGEKNFLIYNANRQDEIKISLPRERFLLLTSRANQLNFQDILKDFISKNNLAITEEQLEDLLGRYFYYLLNTNVEAYSQILKPTSHNASVVVPSDSFSEEERKIINNFLDWEDINKNKQVVYLISLAIEFAFLSNNIDARQYCQSLSNKYFCLDTNLIFRGLGINGENRKKRVDIFLDKCLQSGQKLIITKFTRDEFFSTIDYKISILEKYPFGKSNPEIFLQYGGLDFYNFYHEWRKNRLTNAISYFKIYLNNLYRDFCEKYNISEEFSIPFDQEDVETNKYIEKYISEIQNFKSEKRQVSARIDALNALFVEKKRRNNDLNIIDTKYYLITADHGLKRWDDTHSKNQPIMLLPSQWLGLIFKYTGRATEDDFKCFMSFLRLKTENHSLIDPDRLQLIVAGISEISNDFAEQKNLVDDIIHSHPNLLRCQDDIAYTEARDYALQKIINKYQSEADSQKQTSQDALKKYEIEQYNYRRDRIVEIQRTIESILRRKNRADRKAKKIRVLKLFLISIIAIIYLGGATILFAKKIVSQDHWINISLTLSLPVITFLFSCFRGKKCSVEDCFNFFTIESISQSVYNEYDVDLSELNDLEQEKLKLITLNTSWEGRQVQK